MGPDNDPKQLLKLAVLYREREKGEPMKAHTFLEIADDLEAEARKLSETGVSQDGTLPGSQSQ